MSDFEAMAGVLSGWRGMEVTCEVWLERDPAPSLTWVGLVGLVEPRQGRATWAVGQVGFAIRADVFVGWKWDGDVLEAQLHDEAVRLRLAPERP